MESIGHILKTARETRQMTRSDVAAATKMTSAYVEAIEADNFGALVAPVYARGFIKLYAECVGLDPIPLLQQFGASGRAPPPPFQPPLRARAGQASPKAPPVKASAARAGRPQPPRPQPSGSLFSRGATGKTAPATAGERSPASGPAAKKSIAVHAAAVKTSLITAVRTAGRALIQRLRFVRPALKPALISRLQKLHFKKPDWAFLRMKLPALEWRRIFLIAGSVLLIAAAGLAWEWSRRSMPLMTDACRWLAEPPTPYLTLEKPRRQQ